MNKPYTMSKQQRSDFIAQMDQKWQQKYKRDDTWLAHSDRHPDQLTIRQSEQYLW